MDSESSSDPWMRSAVTLRLTPERKAALRGLCSEPGAAPTAAIDAAIELARTIQLASETEDVTTIVAAQDPQRESQARMERAMEALTRDVGSMKQALLAALTLAEEVSERDADSPLLAPNPTRLREWLDAAEASSALVVAQVSWTSTLRVDSACANLYFSLERWVARDSSGSAVQRAVESALILGPFALADSKLIHALQGATVLACARAGEKWSICAHCSGEDGALAAKSASFLV